MYECAMVSDSTGVTVWACAWSHQTMHVFGPHIWRVYIYIYMWSIAARWNHILQDLRQKTLLNVPGRQGILCSRLGETGWLSNPEKAARCVTLDHRLSTDVNSQACVLVPELVRDLSIQPVIKQHQLQLSVLRTKPHDGYTHICTHKSSKLIKRINSGQRSGMWQKTMTTQYGYSQGWRRLLLKDQRLMTAEVHTHRQLNRTSFDTCYGEYVSVRQHSAQSEL